MCLLMRVVWILTELVFCMDAPVCQPVVEASLWVLRLLLTLCENVLPPNHKLRILALPDLTQLASTNTVRTVMPSVLWSGMNPRIAPNRGRKSPEPNSSARITAAPASPTAGQSKPFSERRREQIVQLLEDRAVCSTLLAAWARFRRE